MVEPLTLDPLADLAGIAHGFFTRAGGVSAGIYDSLNCGPGSKDDPENVAENRRRAAARLGVAAADLVTGYQVHGADVRVVDAADDRGARPRADAMVTRIPGVALGVLTADCAPVLLADPDAGVVGAAHAGWRGAVGGVVDATVAAMERLGARRGRILAAVGPCIGWVSYEVGPGFPAPFLAEDPDNAHFFVDAERAGHFRFNLEGYVLGRLARLGLAGVAASGRDTCTEEDRFFSYRRTTRRGEADYGRALSAIAIGPKIGAQMGG